MGNRKDNKQRYRMADFPSSSDEEDYVLPLPREPFNPSRQHPRTSVDEMPGTSGINSVQPTTSEETSSAAILARKNQAKLDRNFFWSIINHTPAPTENQASRRRQDQIISVKRVTIRPSEEPLGSLEAQRHIKLKNLTHSLQNLEHSLSTGNTAQPSAPYAVPRVSTRTVSPPTRNAPSMVQATTSSSRNITVSVQLPHKSPRTPVSPGHAPPVFSRNAASTSHAAHPYSRPPVSTSYQTAHSDPRPSAAANNGTNTQLRTAFSAGHTVPPTSRDTTNNAASYTQWTPAPPGFTHPEFLFNPNPASHHTPFSTSNTLPTPDPDISAAWTEAATEAIFNSKWDEVTGTYLIPQPLMDRLTTEQNKALGRERAQWRRSLPSFHAREYYDYAMRQMRHASLMNLRSRGTVNVENMDIGSTINVSDEPVHNAPVMVRNPNLEANAENAEGEIAETDLSRHNTSSAGLMEEVMEVAASNVTENLGPQGNKGNEAFDEPTSENTTNVAAVAAELLAEGNAQEESSSHQGLKRKRNSSDDRKEPFSVQDFNQKLLRLLECPVCLEWMEPPIAQCRRGHLVCARCRMRLNACPVCRTPFSSVRNRAMEGVAEMLRYPCRHGCGREVKLRRRTPHESSCASRRYQCPAPECTRHTPLPHDELAHHFQCKHLPILKIGRKHKFSMRVNAEQHDTWLIMAMDEYFHLQVDVDIRTWGVVVYVSYIGPKKNADSYYYEVTVQGQHSSRKLVYTRTTHSDLESPSVNVSRQDCFHLTLDQALNFLRVKNKYCQPDKFLDFDVELSKLEVVGDSMEESDDGPLVDESPKLNAQDD